MSSKIASGRKKSHANTHPNARFDLYNSWLKQEADLRGCLFLDTSSMMQSVPNWENTMFGVDGLHYSPTGEVFVANEFAQAADLATQSNPVVTTNVRVNSLAVGNLHVVANLTAEAIAANSLVIGGSVATVPEPSENVLILVFFILFFVVASGFSWKRHR
jgi:hypothetical protein